MPFVQQRMIIKKLSQPLEKKIPFLKENEKSYSMV